MPPPDPDRARHLLRALLRECTYLPDLASRRHAHDHVLLRFRAYHPTPPRPGLPPKPQAAPTPRRLRAAVKNAQKGLNFLRRANDGVTSPLQKLLFWTYGRVGKRRHELMDSLLEPEPVDSKQALELWQADVDAVLDPSKVIAGLPKTVKELPRTEGEPHKYEISRRYAKLGALLDSQRRAAKPIELRRPKLKSLSLEVPLTNIWARPLPRKRERNMVHRWYADLLDKVLPPLPEDEWQRLRDLVVGARRWEGLRPRRPSPIPSRLSPHDLIKLANSNGIHGDRFLALACREQGLPENGSKTEKISRLAGQRTNPFTPADRWLARESMDQGTLDTVLRDELEITRLSKSASLKSRPQIITARLMRRLWATVFSQCPVLRWDMEQQQWTVEWGSWNGHHPSPKSVSQDMSLFEGVQSDGRAAVKGKKKPAANSQDISVCSPQTPDSGIQSPVL